MATNIGDILQVQHVYDVQGQECRNVFYYEVFETSTGAMVLEAFIDELATYYTDQWQLMVCAEAISRRVQIDNLTNGLDFAETSTDVAGGVTGEAAPAIYALNVTLPRTSKLTRNGSKRISGFNVTRMVDGAWDLGTGVQDAINLYCANSILLPDYDGAGANITLVQRIIGRTLNAEGVYELDLTKINGVGTPIINPVATTQRTRKA